MTSSSERRESATTDQQPTKARAAVTPIMSAFDYDGVTLFPSRFRDQMLRARDVYFGVPNDDWGEEVKAVGEPAAV